MSDLSVRPVPYGRKPQAHSSHGLGTMGAYLPVAALFLHVVTTFAATMAVADVALPFWTAVLMCGVMFFQDRTIYFLYPALILMTLGFISPLVLAGAPIALKVPPNGTEYDRDMILAVYWFIAVFSLYVSAANKMVLHSVDEVEIGKTDLVPILAGLVLLGFSALMLQNGTLLTGGYRDVTEQRFSFIEFASLITLVGFCTAQSRLARNFLIACACVYLAATFLVGLRLRFISVGVVLFCCLIGLRVETRWKLIILGGAFVLFALGLVRNAGFSGADFSQALSLENLYIRGALVSTPGGAFQTSKFHAYYAEYYAAPEGVRGLYFFFADLASIIVTRDGVPDILHIKAQTTQLYDVPGGGLLPGFFYAYGGLLGVVALSGVVTAFFSLVMRGNNPQWLPYQIILAAYAPRTLLYDWNVGFKMMFYFFILHAILRLALAASRNAAPGRRL